MADLTERCTLQAWEALVRRLGVKIGTLPASIGDPQKRNQKPTDPRTFWRRLGWAPVLTV